MKRHVRDVAAVESAEPIQLPAPVGGWNARDSLARMRGDEAVLLDNWFPQATDVVVRPGYDTAASGPVGEAIGSLLSVAKADGTFKRFLATPTGIYDFTGGGAVGAASSVATTKNWESVQINVGGISYLWACAGDGVNKSRIYNSTAATWTLLDGASVPVLTGPTSANVANVSLFKSRLILTEKDSLKFWYGPLNSVGGAFSAFDLGAVFKKGGYLVATANWTVDAGDGSDDRFVAMTSEGEIAIYQGTDPSSATTFELVGVYNVGKPIGKRCFVTLAGELGVLTEHGLWPLSKALQSASIDRRLALTDKIQQAFNDHYKFYGALAGWQVVLLPKGPAILVNVPFSSGSYQFVMNTLTGAWSRFTGWNATCMMVQGGKLYLALGDQVVEGWTGLRDGIAAISAYARTAYTYGPSKLRGKKINLVRPVMTTTDAIQLGLGLDTDFQPDLVGASYTAIALATSLWDVAVFDTGVWGGGATPVKRWYTVRNTPGKAFSLRLAVQVSGVEVSWAATDFIAEAGSIFG